MCALYPAQRRFFSCVLIICCFNSAWRICFFWVLNQKTLVLFLSLWILLLIVGSSVTLYHPPLLLRSYSRLSYHRLKDFIFCGGYFSSFIFYWCSLYSSPHCERFFLSYPTSSASEKFGNFTFLCTWESFMMIFEYFP